MATQDQIFTVRLRIKDPAGFISFVEVADLANLPAAPANQTAYKVTSDGNYYSTTTKTGATSADYSIEELRISDTTLSLYIDTYGEDGATCRALKDVIYTIVQEMDMIKKNDAGADSTEYRDLKQVYDVYKDLLSMCSEEKNSTDGNNSGKYYATLQPEIAGDNL